MSDTAEWGQMLEDLDIKQYLSENYSSILCDNTCCSFGFYMNYNISRKNGVQVRLV